MSGKWFGKVGIILALLAVSALMDAPVRGQDRESAGENAVATATVDAVGAKAAGVMAGLHENIEEIRTYKGRMINASSEDSLVLRLQIAESRDRIKDRLKDLADIAVNSRQGPNMSELRDRVQVVLAEVTPALWELIREQRTEIDGLRARRATTAAGDRYALEERIGLLTTRLDAFNQYGWVHIQSLESLGQDATQARAEFEELIVSRVDELSGRLKLASRRIEELNKLLRNVPDDADAQLLAQATRRNLEINSASFGIALEIMDAMGIPTDRQRAQLVSMTQDLASGLLDVQVTATLLRKAWGGISIWLREKGPGLLMKLIMAGLILVAGIFLARLVRKVVEKALARANLDISQLLRRMIIDFAFNAVKVMAVLIALGQLGFSLAPMLAGLGVVGFILGFAMQDSLSNLAAGMMILINRPYDVEDLVEISGVFGRVSEMSMVSTSILTLDNQKLVVPNSKIWGDVIKNVTDQKVRRVDMVFGISYSDDIPHAEEVLTSILSASDLVLEEPAPIVRLHTLNDSSVDFVVRPWVKTDDYWDAHWEITKAVKMRFDAEGISIPFPQRDVHVYDTKHAEHSPDVPDPRTGSSTNDPDPIAGSEG